MQIRVAVLMLAAGVTLAAQVYPNAKEAADQAAIILPDADAVITRARATRDTAILEKLAAQLVDLRQFEPAKKLLNAALLIHEQVSGTQSADVALCILKLGDLERKHNHAKEVMPLYARAVHLLPNRPETAGAILYLGVQSISRKQFDVALENLQRARDLDQSLTPQSLMWTALIRERQENPGEAEILYKSALAVAPPESSAAANARTLYSRFLKAQGKDGEAEALIRHPLSPIPPATADAANLYKKDGAFRVGGGVKQPAVIYKVDPEYTDEARAAKYSGTVLLQVIIGKDGYAHSIKVVKGIGLGLDVNAAEAVGKWKFRPGMKGVDTEALPVDVYATIEVNFRLL